MLTFYHKSFRKAFLPFTFSRTSIRPLLQWTFMTPYSERPFFLLTFCHALLRKKFLNCSYLLSPHGERPLWYLLSQLTQTQTVDFLSPYSEKHFLLSSSRDTWVRQEYVYAQQRSVVLCIKIGHTWAIMRRPIWSSWELSLAPTEPNLARTGSETWFSFLRTRVWYCLCSKNPFS